MYESVIYRNDRTENRSPFLVSISQPLHRTLNLHQQTKITALMKNDESCRSVRQAELTGARNVGIN